MFTPLFLLVLEELISSTIQIPSDLEAPISPSTITETDYIKVSNYLVLLYGLNLLCSFYDWFIKRKTGDEDNPAVTYHFVEYPYRFW